MQPVDVPDLTWRKLVVDRVGSLTRTHLDGGGARRRRRDRRLPGSLPARRGRQAERCRGQSLPRVWGRPISGSPLVCVGDRVESEPDDGLVMVAVLEKISRLVGHSTAAVTEQVYRKQTRPVIQSGDGQDFEAKTSGTCRDDSIEAWQRPERLVGVTGLNLRPLRPEVRAGASLELDRNDCRGCRTLSATESNRRVAAVLSCCIRGAVTEQCGGDQDD